MAQEPVVLEQAGFRYVIAASGMNSRFLDRANGRDYLSTNPPSPCAWVRLEGREHPATSASLSDNRLTLRFGETLVEAVLGVEGRPGFTRLTVLSLRGKEPEVLRFLNVPLTLKGTPDEPFGACALSLNLATRVDQLPVLQTELRASAHRKFGLIGAQVALVAGPVSSLLPTLKQVLREAKEMPRCQVAGPWADEVPFNHGSYLFNFGTLTEATVEDWSAMARNLGVTQIDNHGGSAAFFRFGDFALNREKWPEGWDTYARIVARLHAAGIGSIFHTYAFFIDKQAKYVTPVPDGRLDAFRTFTLAEGISAEADALAVNESTAGLTTVTGFFEHNSVVLHLGDELVTFAGVSQTSPWRFTGLKRGALGTRATAHAQGARARHLKECFGLFVPDPESSLFEEIAANHAEVVNQGGFDGLYLDAIDGSAILRGNDECWYWADKFVFEIQKRLRRPVGMEMSAMWHHFWQYRTRWQAWDYPQRGHERFIDLHAAAVHGGLLLPLHLGWWNFQSFNPPQIEPTYPETIEYLGARLIGWDAGISLTGGIDRERLRSVPLFRRAVDTLRTCEQLRQSGAVAERVKRELRQPGREFALITNAAGALRFQRAHSTRHTATPQEPWTLAWTVENPFPGQAARLRIEALIAAGAPEDTNAVVLFDPDRFAAADWPQNAATGVTCSLVAGTNVAFIATNAGLVPRPAAWARCARRFAPPLNLKNQQALGVWVDGDGGGEMLALRLESPQHLAFGAIADRYIDVDFTGRRFFTLVETESTRWSDYVWNDGKGLYNVYRETIDFGAVESASVWLQNLAPGVETRCGLGPIIALPMMATKLKDPTVTINGTTVVLPAEVPSGGYIEGTGTQTCTQYDAQGGSPNGLVVRGTWPTLRPGTNRIQFSCAWAPGPAPRARITVFCRGEEL
jgi:hypothetical protein